ncbi:DUF305 domain-containing protein [Candidatus Gottesmanbacteria bacterium]|nr:DUF305 domain-containing protein [Candidatus Gottesmanbacteria bacterium]
MMHEKFIFGVSGIILGALIMWIGSTVSLQSGKPLFSQMGINRTSASSDALDSHFIEQMIPHHEDAITMAKLAETKAKTKEVKELAKNIILSQGNEINQMKAWYKDWFGRELSSNKTTMAQHGMLGGTESMHMGMMGDESDSTRLANAANFDVAFVEDMIPHHQMAVMMANMLKDGSGRPEMKKLADDIIAAQTKEINDMRSWLQTWK